MLAQPIQARFSVARPSELARRAVMGRRGRRTDFSWTWKLQRKKPQAELARAQGRRSARGKREMVMLEGRMAIRVAERERRWRRGVG